MIRATILWVVLVTMLLGILFAPASHAADAVTLRTGDHPGFGRIVFDLPKGVAVQTVETGDRVLLVFRDAADLPDGAASRPSLPRNVAGLTFDGHAATVAIVPGARARPARLGDRLVLDVLDPARPGDPAPAPAPALAPAGPAKRPVAPGTELASGDKSPSDDKATSDKGTGDKTAGETAVSDKAPSGTTPNGMAKAPAPQPLAVPAATREAAAPHSAAPAPAAAKALGVPKSASPAALRSEATRLEPTRPDAPLKAETAPAIPVERADLPARPAVAADPPQAAVPAPAAPPPGPTVTSFTVPADLTVGAAAFRRGTAGVIVLDRRLPVSAAALPGAKVSFGPTTTILTLPIPPGTELLLARTTAGWRIDLPGTPPAEPMVMQNTPAGVLCPLPRPGRVVTVLDPATGGTLLVGTSLVSDPGTAIASVRSTPGYTVLPTWLGVAVAATADQVDLRLVPAGFLLQGAPLPAWTDSGVAGRRFDLPDEPSPALVNRLQALLATAATAPPRARSVPRIMAAQAMLALGLGAEAQALLLAVQADDPQAAADAQVGALAGAAATLADRLDETAGLDDAALADQPDIALWRGIRDRRRGESTSATARLPALMTFAWSYPEPLRRRIWPDVAEAAAEAGVPIPDDRATPFAKAIALERAGKLEEAIAAWKALADGQDRRDAVRAEARGIEASLASGRITAAQAADRAERLTFAWRGDSRELALRVRAAELRAAAGGWRAALDSLRETETLFPAQAATIPPRKAAVFASMLAAEGGSLSPLEVVLMAADYADCVPPGPAGAGLARLLAEKLMALDLPARAIPVLQGLVKSTAAGPARAEFGARLARLLLEGGDPGGAVDALEASAAPNLSPPLLEMRAIVGARSRAAKGDVATAVAELKALGTPAAHDARATLLAEAGEWGGSLAALSDLAALLIPAQGPLDETAQAVVMRQATTAVRVPDAAALRSLAQFAPRMSPNRADLLRMLTEEPVTAPGELPRAARELSVARFIPRPF